MISSIQTQDKADINRWLYTFGDLLTLLLCFFVTMLTISPLNPEVGTNRTRSQNPPTHGTPFAQPAERIITLRWNFDLSNSAEDVSGSRRIQRRVQKLLMFRHFSADAARIQSCWPTSEDGSESSWEVSLNRALDVKRQLIDGGLMVQAVKLRVLGPRCEVLGGKSGVLSIVGRKRVKNR